MSTMSDKDHAQKPTTAAVALRYDGDRAPTVAATGTHGLAEEIVRIARDHGVPLYENPELAATLARLSLNEEIPETLYRVIAEILAFAFHIQGRTPFDDDQAT
ncbi:EscU/YscU/HrcU family type III secretion system export apparatus switch protein [Marinobacter sp. C2H3]|uniref:EscU/YscU/HrcU family type III secretion system export apparatus switch protein n=1 Tax=Marinobacter sp. C2H3 TaxID=3119003 RepID=UPI00300F294A